VAAFLALAVPSARARGIHTVNIAPPGAQESIALDINNHGDAIGVWGDAPLGQGFLYSGGSTATIHPPGWDLSIPMRIDEDGRIVGYGEEGGVRKGFLYSGGVYTTLLPPGYTSAEARAVGPGGVAGGWGTVGASRVGFIYSSGIYVPVVPPGYTQSKVNDIGATGAIVGSADTGGDSQAFLFDGTYHFPSPPGWTDTEAVLINDSGVVLGTGTDGVGLPKCYLAQGGAYTEIVPPSTIVSICGGLNDRGDVTGFGISISGSYIVFIYRDGEYHILDTLFTSILGSPAINDRWQLAGAALEPTAKIAYLLPDPDLKAGGSDGPLDIGVAATPNLKAAVTGWTFAGRKVDWYLFAQTPAGPRSYDPFGRRWVPGVVASARIPLRDLKPVGIPPAGTAPGAYTYYFGIDLKGDGKFDPQYFVFDTLVMFVH